MWEQILANINFNFRQYCIIIKYKLNASWSQDISGALDKEVHVAGVCIQNLRSA